MSGWRSWIAPALLVLALLGTWEAWVRIAEVPQYLVPAPSLIATTLWANLDSLLPSWWYTVRITFGALALAAIGGALIACTFALSRTLERALLPVAIVLQVTPIVAIAPLVLIYLDDTTAALLLCAWIVAFFPVLANTLAGLRAVDPGLRELFALHGASPWQRLGLLLLPTAVPYFMAGLRIAGGLALIGAVVAEFAAGAAGRETGLASRILEASFRTEIPRMYAALVLVSLTGIAIHALFGALDRWLGSRWSGRGTADRTGS